MDFEKFFSGIAEIQVNWKKVLIVLAIIAVTIITSRLLRWLITRSFKVASGKIKVDPTRYKFSKNAVSHIIWMIALGAIALMIPELKSLAITLFAGAGILVAILGFAAQEAFSNIIGGIFLVIFKPFRVGDFIKVGDRDYGIVEDITLRHTVIVNFENKRIIVPNSVINKETIINDNIDDEKICRFIEVAVAYDTELDKAIKILQQTVEEHPDFIDNRTIKETAENKDKVTIRVYFKDYYIQLIAFAWTDDPLKVFQMHTDINRAIKKRFDEAGIEIPFPYRTIVYKKDIRNEPTT